MKPLFFASCALLVFAAALSPLEAASLETTAYVGAGNSGYDDQEQWGEWITLLGPGAYQASDSGAAVSAAGVRDFSGLNQEGSEATMSFQGSASASAAYGRLRTQAYGRVENAFYNEENDPFNFDTHYDPDGTPNVLNSHGQATYTDEFTYSDASAAVTVNFFFKITGNFTGLNASHSVRVNFNGQSDYIHISPVVDPLGVDHLWATKMFTLTANTPLEHSVTVLTQFNLDTQSYNEGDYESSADFSNTVTMEGMELYDGDGVALTGWSLSSGSGTSYPLSPIPEPGTVSLLMLGGAALLRLKRRR